MVQILVLRNEMHSDWKGAFLKCVMSNIKLKIFPKFRRFIKPIFHTVHNVSLVEYTFTMLEKYFSMLFIMFAFVPHKVKSQEEQLFPVPLEFPIE